MSEFVSEKPGPGRDQALWAFASATHVGDRPCQEDAFDFWTNDDRTDWFAVLADGAGGHGGGAAAAAAVLHAAKECWVRRSEPCDGRAFVAEWVQEAHQAVNREAHRGGGDYRASAVALLVRGSRADWAHAGDCRLYHFRGGGCLNRTRDDSVVQILFEQGEIAEEEMSRHPDQNRLLQALGGKELPVPRLGAALMEPGDGFLLCSDGFWASISAGEMAALFECPSDARGEPLPQAVSLAVSRRGRGADNATVFIASRGGVKVPACASVEKPVALTGSPDEPETRLIPAPAAGAEGQHDQANGETRSHALGQS